MLALFMTLLCTQVIHDVLLSSHVTITMQFRVYTGAIYTEIIMPLLHCVLHKCLTKPHTQPTCMWHGYEATVPLLILAR